jgi:hypothetical protein
MSYRNDLVPAQWEANTPSDTAFVNYVGFYVGVTGDVTAQSIPGTSVLFKAVPAGGVIPGVFVRIMATGTTATNICGAKPV